MRLAIIGDSHFSARSRFEECVRVHDWIAQDARRRNVDAIIHTGDLYDHQTAPGERDAAAEWVQKMADIAPVVIVRGNHDPLGDLPLLERLRAHHMITVVETAATIFLDTKAGALAIGALAWPQRSNIAQLAAIGSGEAVNIAAADALRGVFRYFGAFFDQQPSHIPRIVAAHAMVRASRVSTGQPLVGCDFEIGLEDLSLAGADFVALGHVHMGQGWHATNGAPIAYPGSPRRTNFGELETKGYIIAEFSDRLVGLGVIDTPTTPMLLLEDIWAWFPDEQRDDWQKHWELREEEQDPVAGADIKFRYSVLSSKREAAALAAQSVADALLKRGAISVVCDPVVLVEQRARAPEVARASTLKDKVVALWDSKGFDPAERRDALFDKISRLDGS